jgi:CDP-diacylglycerol---serine O-phosphatidyltransferase
MDASAPSSKGIFPVVAYFNLANAITATSIVLGVTAGVLAARGSLLAALICGMCTLPCDVLDGLVARKMGTASEFGAHLDTLADATSFCVLPALLGNALGVTGPMTALLVWFTLGGMARLARFGVVGTSGSGMSETFEGIPTTFIAGCFYITVAVAAYVPKAASLPLLYAFYGVAPLLMNAAFPFPKRGFHAPLMFVSVPLSAVALALKAWKG